MRLVDYPALRHRNFRLLWAGQSVSLTGSMMQNAAVLWHVALLAPAGEKPIALGLVGLARVVPILACALIGGAVADAFDRRRTMLVTQTAMALLAAALAWLSFRGLESLWPLYLLTGLSAAAAAFDGPARTSLVPGLVPREHLPNAVALNTTLFQLCSVIGPSLAGVALVWLEVSWVYLANALSFLAVIAGLLAMRAVPRVAEANRPRVSLASIAEGVRFVFTAPLVRGSMLLDFCASFFSTATALLPIFAVDVLAVGPAGYGWLYAAPSVGAVAASAWLVHRESSIRRRGFVLIATCVAYGLATVAFGLSTSFPLTLLCLAAIGAADTVNMVLRNVIRQLHTPDHVRGRMVGVNLVFAQGGPQLGELEAGLVAQGFGAPFSVVTGGLACVLTSGWIALRTPELRRYQGAPSQAPATPVPAQRTTSAA